MHCSLEIHFERKIFQYLMNSTLSLIRIMSITNEMLVVPQIQVYHYGEHSFKSRSINSWHLYQRNLKTDLTRNAMRCNNRYDLLHLIFTLQI